MLSGPHNCRVRILSVYPAAARRAGGTRADAGWQSAAAPAPAWSDGTRAIRFEPSELLEKLAAMIPKPRVNLLVYHGVFAPNSRRRQSAVRRAQEGAQQGALPQTLDEEAGDPTATDGAPVSSAEIVHSRSETPTSISRS